MDGISALTKETPESSLAASTVGGHSKKMAIYEPESRLSQDTGSDLGYLSLQNCEN